MAPGLRIGLANGTRFSRRAERGEHGRLQALVSQPFPVTGDIRFLDYLALQPFAAFDYQNFGLITIKPSEMSGKTVATIPQKYHL